MKVRSVAAIPASIPYTHRENSAVVARDGVSDVVIRVEAEDGSVGWGESCAGADTESVVAAVKAMAPLVVGRSCWDAERMRRDVFGPALWQFRQGTANFAWAGIDMALWDICGKQADVPLYQLLGGAVRDSVNYYCYLAWDTDEGLRQQCADGLALGYEAFYLKIGLDIDDDLRRVALLRDALGPTPLLRLDANAAWSEAEAQRNLRSLSVYDIDFVEQPVRETPVELMQRIRGRGIVPISANEGLWTEADAINRVLIDTADVYCFSPYWVGGLRSFQFVGTLAAHRGAAVCKHSHGEFAIAAAASHHVMLTLPSIVKGNQHTATIMTADLASIPISSGPEWGRPEGPGLGITVDEDALEDAAARYRSEGQFMPYQLAHLRGTW
jgi:L-alanine-DL-glutamate epimerase-like enolase superfamily enzyme